MNNISLINQSLDSLLKGCSYNISVFSNAAGFIFHSFKDINWVGFYYITDKEMYLGPYQGNVACSILPLSKGVCAKSVQTKSTIVVDNVNLFDGHISCDNNSKSEMVIPIFQNDNLIAVLDIDSPIFNRFDIITQKELQQSALIISRNLKSPV